MTQWSNVVLLARVDDVQRGVTRETRSVVVPVEHEANAPPHEIIEMALELASEAVLWARY